MKLKYLILSIFVLAALSFVVYSLSTLINVTDDISLEKLQDCNTVYWNESTHIIGNCIRYYNTTICDDEPFNTSCYIGEKSYNYSCRIGTKVVEKNKEVCTEKEFQFTVTRLPKDEKYRLEYGQWGKCSYEADGETLVVTCDSMYDGNNDGICSSGESCIQFQITKDGTQRFVKNSREDYAIQDETFFLEKLGLEEVLE